MHGYIKFKMIGLLAAFAGGSRQVAVENFDSPDLPAEVRQITVFNLFQ
jgi:hypothetical protein